MATFKHISSKNADYGAAEAYLTFEHDEFTMKPTLDEAGRLILREDYRIATLNCGEEDFAVAAVDVDKIIQLVKDFVAELSAFVVVHRADEDHQLFDGW